MHIAARVQNASGRYRAMVRTGDVEQILAVPAKPTGSGSGVNGGELLFLVLATHYCNDLYQEAQERGIEVHSIEVEVTGQFGAKGESAKYISYRPTIRAEATDEAIQDLIRHTPTL